MIRLFGISFSGAVIALILSETVLITLCYVLGMYIAVGSETPFYLNNDDGWARILVVVIILQVGLYLADLYEHFREAVRGALLQQLCLILGVAFLVQAILGYGDSNLLLSRWTMVYGSALTLVSIPLWRYIYIPLIQQSLPADKLLLLGTSELTGEIVVQLKERPELRIAVMGCLEETPSGQAPHLGSPQQLAAVIREHKPNRIVLGPPQAWEALPVSELMDLWFAGTRVEDAATTYEMLFGRVPTREIPSSRWITLAEAAPAGWVVQLRDLYSFVLAIIGLVIAFPIMVVVAILVKLTSPGPIFFTQRRVGVRGAEFRVFKFRSMRSDAEATTGAVWATQNDPRITPLGVWLRKLRLDELPQLVNVLRGEMSIVGPRPERPEFVGVLAAKLPLYPHRHCVKPGITGWAQINHKYGDTIEDTLIKLEYDLYYIKHLSPTLDGYIIFHTMKVMLLSRGAQ